MVTADGATKPCCFSTGTLGNLHESSAEGIWNGPIAVELRQFITENRIHPVCANAPCKFVNGMPASPPAVFTADRPDQFDETWYLEAHPDVAEGVRQGFFESGWHHYCAHGRDEKRLPRAPK